MSGFYDGLRSRWRRLCHSESIYEQPFTIKLQTTDQEQDKHTIKKRSTDQDNVNCPLHYNQTDIECIDAIEAATDEGFAYYLQGNILKYLWRYRYKNGIEDLKKAEWYLQKLIKIMEEG
tara:strand:+ start:53 stop:409 length:357 start_codon:yes stop_codon:yes gene_type:complete